jgi:hypothetical protein
MNNKCDICSSDKNVQSMRSDKDRYIDEDSIREWVKDYTGKDFSWFPKLCSGCLDKWKTFYYNRKVK